MLSGRLQRLLAVVVLAVGILAVVAIVAPRPEPAIEPGISTTSTAPGAAATVELPDPCELVTISDAATALGRPVEAGREGESSCVYAGSNGPDATLRVDVAGSPGGTERLAAERADAIRAFGAGAVVDVEGLGDASFLTDAPNAGIVLLRVVCGPVTVVIGIAGQVPDAPAIVLGLATAALGRL